jgi:hypothetical protein
MGSTFAIGIVLLIVVALAAFFKVMLTNEAEQDHQERVTEQVEKDRRKRERIYARIGDLPDVDCSRSFEYQRPGDKASLRPIYVSHSTIEYSDDPYNLRTYTRDIPIRWEPGAAKLPANEVVFERLKDPVHGDYWYAHDRHNRWHPNLG